MAANKHKNKIVASISIIINQLLTLPSYTGLDVLTFKHSSAATPKSHKLHTYIYTHTYTIHTYIIYIHI